LILPEWKLAYFEGILRYDLVSIEDFSKNNPSFVTEYFFEMFSEISDGDVVRNISGIYGIVYWDLIGEDR